MVGWLVGCLVGWLVDWLVRYLKNPRKIQLRFLKIISCPRLMTKHNTEDNFEMSNVTHRRVTPYYLRPGVKITGLSDVL
jgi:hypothetical protein